MYNAELKSRFVKDYTKSINTANVATTVFEAFEPYETSWNADLCTRDREELSMRYLHCAPEASGCLSRY